MPVNKPTHPGLWWFRGTFHGQPFEGPIRYDGSEHYPIEIIACDEIIELERFDGQYWPLSMDVVRRGNALAGAA